MMMFMGLSAFQPVIVQQRLRQVRSDSIKFRHQVVDLTDLLGAELVIS